MVRYQPRSRDTHASDIISLRAMHGTGIEGKKIAIDPVKACAETFAMHGVL